jgi:methyl-accepting chemotaxis protein
MISPEKESARSAEEINGRITAIQKEVIQTFDQLDAAIRESQSPESLLERLGELRNSITKLWLYHAAVLAALEERDKS